MDEQKTPKEEYSFMQEVIKDEADSAGKIRNKVFRMAGYGVILGIAASITFCALKPWMDTNFNNHPSQVEIPEDEEEDEPEKQQAEEEASVPDTDDYRKVLQNLNTTATAAKKSMAVVSCFSSGAGNTEAKASTAGVIIADNGREFLVFSNILPVKETDTLQITFSDGKSYNAVEKMGDHNLGLCTYAVSKDQMEETTKSVIQTIEFGSSNAVETGETVIALGRPFGTDQAVGYGAVAADEEYAELADGHYRLLCTNITGNVQGTGSGALINRQGRLIGIIHPSVLGEGSSNRIGGYAISDIKGIIEHLSNESAIPYTGIYGMDVTEKLIKKENMPQGVYVKEVAVDSPAMAAGIQSGDVIVGIDGEDIGNLYNYHSILMEKSEGSEINLKGCRQGTGGEYVDIDFKVTVGSKNKD